MRMKKKASFNGNARQISKMIDNGLIVFDSLIQRGLVWNNDQKSLFIHSMIEDYIIYPMVARKEERNGEKVYSVTDGKQRLLGTVNAYLNNKFALTNIPEVELDDKSLVDINGMYFKDLPEEIQDAINSFTLTIYYYEDISEDQEADIFFRINNGSKLTNIEINRAKCKSLNDVDILGHHELFTTSLTEKAFEKYTHEELVIKSYIMMTSNTPCLENKYVKKVMENAEFTEDDIYNLTAVFDRILNTYKTLISDESDEKIAKKNKRIAKRLIGRTHMLSVIPMVKRSLDENVSSDVFNAWVKNFFSGSKSVTKYEEYNTRCTSGSSSIGAIKVRLDIVKKDYEEFMKDVKIEPKKNEETEVVNVEEAADEDTEVETVNSNEAEVEADTKTESNDVEAESESVVTDTETETTESKDTTENVADVA